MPPVVEERVRLFDFLVLMFHIIVADVFGCSISSVRTVFRI